MNLTRTSICMHSDANREVIDAFINFNIPFLQVPTSAVFCLSANSVCFRYKIDFATMVTEDSSIFSSVPGETDVRGKGSQFEASLHFIRHFAMTKDSDLRTFVMCIDADLKGEITCQTGSYCLDIKERLFRGEINIGKQQPP